MCPPNPARAARTLSWGPGGPRLSRAQARRPAPQPSHTPGSPQAGPRVAERSTSRPAPAGAQGLADTASGPRLPRKDPIHTGHRNFES